MEQGNKATGEQQNRGIAERTTGHPRVLEPRRESHTAEVVAICDHLGLFRGSAPRRPSAARVASVP